MYKPARLLLSIALFLAAACSKKSDGPTSSNGTTGGNGTAGTNSMSAKIDGAQWTAYTVAVQKSTGYVIVSGASLDSKAIAVLFATSGTGTQSIVLGGVMNGNVIINGASWSASGLFPATSGSVTLTTLTATRAVGTFTLTLQATLTTTTPQQRLVTGGAFDVTF